MYRFVWISDLLAGKAVCTYKFYLSNLLFACSFSLIYDVQHCLRILNKCWYFRCWGLVHSGMHCSYGRTYRVVNWQKSKHYVGDSILGYFVLSIFHLYRHRTALLGIHPTAWPWRNEDLCIWCFYLHYTAQMACGKTRKTSKCQIRKISIL